MCGIASTGENLPYVLSGACVADCPEGFVVEADGEECVLDVDGCVTDADCGNGYAVSDVYYTEVCVMSHICRNRDALFKLRVGELFECDFDEAAFLGLRNILGSGSG